MQDGGGRVKDAAGRPRLAAFLRKRPPLQEAPCCATTNGVWELDVRMKAFAWLKENGAANGGVFPGRVLNEGFMYEGRRVTLKGTPGNLVPPGFLSPHFHHNKEEWALSP